MLIKAGLLFVALLVGGNAFPAAEKEQDMSIFFDHTDPSARIVGGNTAGNVPFMVALSQGVLIRGLLCGGSLVTTRHVVTAAHCIAAVVSGGSLINSLRGTVGTNRWNTGGNTFTFARHVNHPHYNPSTIKNDIGVLVTSGNIGLSNTVGLAVLNYDWVSGGVSTSVTGWGRTTAGGSLSAVLLQLNAFVVDGNVCVRQVADRANQLNIRAPAVDPNLEICTFLSDGRGTCNGDSGSPLMRTDRNQQIGVVSWGLPCARNAPDMFARVSSYRAWLASALT